jgi:hypothetical protein
MARGVAYGVLWGKVLAEAAERPEDTVERFRRDEPGKPVERLDHVAGCRPERVRRHQVRLFARIARPMHSSTNAKAYAMSRSLLIAAAS